MERTERREQRMAEGTERLLRVLIVDDEELGRSLLRSRLELVPDVEIVGEAVDGPSAVEAIEDARPDLVFLDIQMPGMDGLEVLERVARTHLPLVVFVTAHDEYAIRAFELHALDYLLKPVAGRRLVESLERARQQLAAHEATQQALERVSRFLDAREEERDDAARPAADRPPTEGSVRLRRLLVREGNDYVLVRTEDIESFEAAGNYVRVSTRGGKSYLIRSTMTDIERQVDPEQFVRIHRSTIVNIDRIAQIRPQPHGDFQITLQGGRKLRMSRHYRERLLS
jgi:two-component system LytT family response regulator